MEFVCVCLPIVFSLGTVFPATASDCTSGQQCSSCEDSIGHCTTGCFKGFYGHRCNIRCSQGCKDNLCIRHGVGTETCVAGCKPGFYGTRCNIPCIHYGNNCTGCGAYCEVCDQRSGICLKETSPHDTDEPCTPLNKGPNCRLKCSPGCNNGTCRLDDDGTFPCTDGCKPGWFGTLCKIPCQPPGDSCRECPTKCDDGFCQLASSCVSGCIDSYYGTSCFTCGSDCQVCNRYTDRCYNCTDGCPFSSCHEQDQCQDRRHTTVSATGGKVYVSVLTAGLGISALVIVSLVVFIKLRIKKRRQRATIQLAQTVSSGVTEGYTALRRSTIGSYIHAVNDPYHEVYEEETI